MTGASGQLGAKVAACLARSNVCASLIQRHARQDGAHTVLYGDLDKPETLGPALQGVQVLILITADGPRQAAQGQAAIRAAKAAGVERVVVVSAMLAGETPPLSFGVQHAAIEHALRESAITHTILRPSFFMQSFGLFADQIRQGRLIIPVPSGQISFVDLEDVAEAVALCALRPMPVAQSGRPLILTGDAALTFGAAAALIAAATGRPVKHVAPPRWMAGIILGIATGRWTGARLIELFAALEAGLEAEIHNDLAHVLGRAPCRFADFATRERAMFMRPDRPD